MKPVGAYQVRRHIESSRRIAESLRLQHKAALQHAKETSDDAARDMWNEVAASDLNAAAAIEKDCDELLKKYGLLET